MLNLSTDDGDLYAVNAATGTQMWHKRIPAHVNVSSPAIAGGALYVGSGSKQVFAFSLP